MEAITNIGDKIKFKDGTEYMRMPNGELRRMSPKASEIRRSQKRLNKIKNKNK
jgi:hypothetical protein